MAKGQKTGGRAKGTPNKQTALLKDAILEAAKMAGGDLRPDERDGMVSYLRWLAVEEAPSFATLMGKVLPMQVTGENGGEIKTHSRIEIVVVDPA